MFTFYTYFFPAYNICWLQLEPPPPYVVTMQTSAQAGGLNITKGSREIRTVEKEKAECRRQYEQVLNITQVWGDQNS